MMIRPPAEDGLMIIPQTDHSRLVGQLAAHWGNDRFAAPTPYDSVVRAAMFHDFGWLRYETSPAFNEATGGTPDFIHASVDRFELESYQWTHDWLLEQDPYAGLIANMHRTGIWRGRYDAITHPPHPIFSNLGPDIEAFIVRNEQQQQQALATVDQAVFRTNFRLMQVWDILGIYFCCQEPYPDYIEPVPTSYGDKDEEGVRITLTPLSPTRVRFDPFPFDEDGQQVQLSYKHLPRSKWPDAETFRKEYFKAPTRIINLELCA